MNIALRHFSIAQVTSSSPIFSVSSRLSVFWTRMSKFSCLFVFSSGFSSLKVFKSSFDHSLNRVFVIDGDYSHIYYSRQFFGGNVSLESIKFRNCFSELSGASFYVSSGVTLKVSDCYFMSCKSSAGYSCYDVSLSSHELVRTCFFKCGNAQIKAHVTNSNQNNKIWLSSFSQSVGSAAYLITGLCYYNSLNVSNNYGGIGHAGDHPAVYEMIHCCFSDISSNFVVSPSCAQSKTASIESCNFVLIRSPFIIYHWGYSLYAKKCIFIMCEGSAAARNPNDSSGTIIDLIECYSDRSLTSTGRMTNCVEYLSNITEIPITNVNTCDFPEYTQHLLLEKGILSKKVVLFYSLLNAQ